LRRAAASRFALFHLVSSRFPCFTCCHLHHAFITMPIAPPSTTYTCPACGWSKTVTPRSDALGPGDYYRACPKCAHAPLATSRASAAQAALGQLSEQFKRLLR